MEAIKMAEFVWGYQDNIFSDRDVQNPHVPHYPAAMVLASKGSSNILVKLFCTKFATLPL